MDKSPIIRLGNPELRHACVDVVFPNTQLNAISAAMFLVMYKAKGIGLAANQIGIRERIAVVDILEGAQPITLINPTIVEFSGEQDDIEGCLSLPGFAHAVKRANVIKVKNFDFDGKEAIIEAEGFLARALQHEIDHLDGKVFLDRLTPLERRLQENYIKRLVRSYKKEDKGMPFEF